jgi:hypothetical protein
MNTSADHLKISLLGQLSLRLGKLSMMNYKQSMLLITYL